MSETSPQSVLKLLSAVRADYVAMARECHGLRKYCRKFDANKLPLIAAMDEAINGLSLIVKSQIK